MMEDSKKGDYRNGLLRAAAIAQESAHALANSMLASEAAASDINDIPDDPVTRAWSRGRIDGARTVESIILAEAERETPARKDSDPGWATDLEAAMVKGGIFEMTIIRGPDDGGIVRARGISVDPNSVSLDTNVTLRWRPIAHENIYVGDLASVIEDIFK